MVALCLCDCFNICSCAVCRQMYREYFSANKEKDLEVKYHFVSVSHVCSLCLGCSRLTPTWGNGCHALLTYLLLLRQEQNHTFPPCRTFIEPLISLQVIITLQGQRSSAAAETVNILSHSFICMTAMSSQFGYTTHKAPTVQKSPELWVPQSQVSVCFSWLVVDQIPEVWA